MADTAKVNAEILSKLESIGFSTSQSDKNGKIEAVSIGEGWRDDMVICKQRYGPVPPLPQLLVRVQNQQNSLLISPTAYGVILAKE